MVHYKYNIICQKIKTLRSNYCPILSEWFPGDSEDMRNERIIRLAVNWLQDADNPFGSTKAWCYFNSGD